MHAQSSCDIKQDFNTFSKVKIRFDGIKSRFKMISRAVGDISRVPESTGTRVYIKTGSRAKRYLGF